MFKPNNQCQRSDQCGERMGKICGHGGIIFANDGAKGKDEQWDQDKKCTELTFIAQKCAVPDFALPMPVARLRSVK